MSFRRRPRERQPSAAILSGKDAYATDTAFSIYIFLKSSFLAPSIGVSPKQTVWFRFRLDLDLWGKKYNKKEIITNRYNLKERKMKNCVKKIEVCAFPKW